MIFERLIGDPAGGNDIVNDYVPVGAWIICVVGICQVDMGEKQLPVFHQWFTAEVIVGVTESETGLSGRFRVRSINTTGSLTRPALYVMRCRVLPIGDVVVSGKLQQPPGCVGVTGYRDMTYNDILPPVILSIVDIVTNLEGCIRITFVILFIGGPDARRMAGIAIIVLLGMADKTVVPFIR